MAGRTGKDSFKRSPRGNKSTTKWSSPDRLHGIPSGALEVKDCNIENHYIAREKSSESSWQIRPYIDGNETSHNTSLQFFVANADQVCWQKGATDRIPDDAIIITDGPRSKPNTFIGRHKEKGVGQIEFQDQSKFVFISASGDQFENNYDVLCKNK